MLRAGGLAVDHSGKLKAGREVERARFCIWKYHAGRWGKLWDQIRRAVQEERYGFSAHADEQMRERSIRHWQVVAGVSAARLVRERPRARPNSVVEVEQMLADGTAVIAVWAWLAPERTAKLVTVHFMDNRLKLKS